MIKHHWTNKRTPKGVKPVVEWIECKLCGMRRPDNPQNECKADDAS